MRIKLLLFIAVIMMQSFVSAQEIVNIVLVGNEGVTQNVKDAHSFIVVKKYAGSIFQRLDYKLGGPLVKLRTYNDSNLTSLQGAYLEYHANGGIRFKGQYDQNLKTTEWYQFDDTGKHVFTEVYDKGLLVDSHPPDTTKKDTTKYKDDREANLKGGIKTWISYLQKTTNGDVGLQSVRGGKVMVFFSVDTEGNLVDISMKKSVEFVLDEEALRVIRNSPK